MTIPEMCWVLENVKECVEHRNDNTCCRDCKKCQCSIEYTSLMNALESIISLVLRTGEKGRRK